MSTAELPPAAASDPILDRVPFLSLMPGEVRTLVDASFTRVRFDFGDTIVAEGDDADAVYVLLAGTARAVKAGDHGQEVPLSLMGPGDAFGERALIDSAGRRTATVRASSPVEALKLDKGVFRALVNSNPAIEEYVRLHIRRLELRDFLRVHSEFARLPAVALATLLERLEPLSVMAGEVVIRRGDPPGPMYLVREGRLRAYVETDGRREGVSFLRKGSYFGERSLFAGSSRAATVEAVTDCELLTLSADVFERLLEEHPRFREQIEQRVSQYDYKKRARVPLDFAEELLPADAGARELVSLEPAERVVEGASRELPPPEDAGWDGFVRPANRIRRFPHVHQVDMTDCGAASLAIICRYFGRKVSLPYVRQAASSGSDGTSLLGISRGAEQLGLAATTTKVSKARLDEMPLPAVLHWEGNHWLVLYDVDAEHARISDPATGRRRIKRSELEEKWSGYAAFFARTPAFEQAPLEGSRIAWARDLVRPHRRVLGAVLGFTILTACVEMAIPLLMGFVVDTVIAERNVGVLTLVVGGLLAALALTVVVTLAQRRSLSKISVRLDTDSLDFISGKLLAQPMSYFNARKTGDIERRLNGLRQVRQFLIEYGVAGVASAAQAVAAVGAMFVVSWTLALIFLAMTPIYAVLMWFSASRLRPAFDSLEEAWGRYQSRQIDSMKGIETVKAMGAEHALRRLLLRQFDELSDRLFGADYTTMAYQSAVQLVSFLTLTLFLWFGAFEVINHNLTLGGLVAFNALVVLANAAIVAVLLLWNELQYASILLGRLNDILEHEPEQGEDHSGLRSVRSLSGHIRFAAMSFAYPGPVASPILEDIDFEVQPGTTVAIVGRSGSGKTTLIKVLAGLLEPTMGTILYDGVDLKTLNYRDLRRNIGFVLQVNHMFDATIAENIAFGEEDIDFDRVLWAAGVANAAEFIERLPLGYDTRIGESGMLLSGGQCQRIAIARAIYHQPPVLIFDEATSALDTESERAVKENMDQLLEGRTSFVIAHRLSTVRDADVILVLEKGRLVEQGTHDELMARQGLYYYLCSQQLEM